MSNPFGIFFGVLMMLMINILLEIININSKHIHNFLREHLRFTKEWDYLSFHLYYYKPKIILFNTGSASHSISLFVQLTVEVTAFQTGRDVISTQTPLRHKVTCLKLTAKGTDCDILSIQDCHHVGLKFIIYWKSEQQISRSRRYASFWEIRE